MSEDPIDQLERAANHFDSINNELEQLKAELSQRSHQIVQTLPKHELQILAAEKSMNKDFTKARKSLVASTSQPVLNFGTVTPEMEKSMGILVAQHLENNGFKTVAQLMRADEKNKSARDGNTELSDFEVRANQLFNNVIFNMLTMQVAFERGMSHEMFMDFKVSGLRLRFYKALSQSTAEAFEFLKLEGALVFQKDTPSAEDLIAVTVRAMSEELRCLGHELMTLSSEEASRKYKVLRHSVFNKLLLFCASERDSRKSVEMLGCYADEEEPKVSDLELLAEASQQALASNFKELRMVDWSNDVELPVEFKLDSDKFRFHPIFVCPVTREQNTGNAIVLLKCGHLLSREAFHRFVVMRGESKCPYCPAIVRLRDERYVKLAMI